MDTIKANGYDDLNDDYDAAHIVWDEPSAQPGSRLVIVARVPEPQARMDDEPDWDEGAWRDAVREAVNTAGWDEPESDNEVTIWLTWDPGRDNIQEEQIAHKPAAVNV